MASILCIEDDPDLQKIVGEALLAQGHGVHYAFSGQEGLGKVKTVRPDLVVLDLLLPGLSGVEVIAALRARPETRSLPVIVVTAHEDPQSLVSRSLAALGATAFVAKPVEPERLCGAIAAALSKAPPRPRPVEIRKGALRADARFRKLWVNGRKVATLPPKMFALARMLMEAGGPVSRERLLSEGWGKEGSAFALAKAIQRLREALGRDARRLQTTADGYELIG